MDCIKPHVLIVEDDEDTRFVYSVLLQMEGYDVTHVGMMSDALARVLSTNYDLIVMDVRLPDGDGVELCRQIRVFNRVTPIMFVSAAAYQKDIDRGMKAGAQAYLTKPAAAEVLLDRINYLLGQKAMIEMQKNSSALPVLVNAAPVAAALIGRDQCYKAVSQSYAEAGGYNAMELVGKAATDIFPDVSGEAGRMLEQVRLSKLPYFISRYPYATPQQPERGVTYWDAALWPIESGESETDVLVVVRQKEKSGDIVAV